MEKILNLIHSLSNSDWLISAKQIKLTLKPLIQGSDGVVAKLKKDKFNKIRKDKLKKISNDFDIKKSTIDLDNRIDEYSNQMNIINSEIHDTISYDYINMFSEDIIWESKNKDLEIIIDYIINKKINNITTLNRLNNIVSQLIFGSMSQSNKTLAGISGEELARSILISAGLKDGKDFRSQYQSEAGSNTDFILPFVEDFNDTKVQCCIAVQYSSNDRARMVDSELKNGTKFFMTFNGCRGSTKKLQNISKTIIANQKISHFRLVCLKSHLESEKVRVEEQIDNGKDVDSNQTILKFYNKNSMGFEEFAEEINKRYVH